MKQQLAHHNLPNFKEALKAKWCPKKSIRIFKFGRFSVGFFKKIEELSEHCHPGSLV